jgi:hypothetical protein
MRVSKIMLPIYLLFVYSFVGQDSFVRFEVFMAVTVKNAVFWDVTPRGS